MKMVPKVASGMQTVLTTTANQLAEKHQLIVRQRKFTGETLAQTLVFGWLTPVHLDGQPVALAPS